MSAVPPKPVTHREITKGAGAALLGRLGGVVEVVAQPAYTLMYGLATYGLYTVLWSLVNLIENVADLGMTSALQRVVPQTYSEEDAVAALRAALLLGLTPCLLIAAGASLAAPELSDIINVSADDRAQLATGIGLFAWALPLWAFVEIGTSALRARRAFGPEIRLRIFWEQIFRLAIATGLWAAGVDTLGLLIAHLASLTITAGATLRLLSRYYDLRLLFKRTLNRPVFLDTLLSGLSMLPANVITRAFSDIPPVVLNLWLPGAAGANAAGLYGIARRLTSLIQIVRMAFAYVLGPLASAVARDDRGAIQPLYAFTTRLSTVLGLPVAAAIIGGGDVLLKAFGKEGAGAWPLLLPLAIARAFEVVGGPASTVQLIASRRIQPVISSGVGLVIAAIVAPILMPVIGPPGMAIAIALGIVTSIAASLVQLHYRDSLNPFAPPFGRALGTAGVTSLSMTAILLATLAAPLSVRAGLLVAALFGGLWISVRFGLNAQDKQAFGKVGRRLRLGGAESST